MAVPLMLPEGCYKSITFSTILTKVFKELAYYQFYSVFGEDFQATVCSILMTTMAAVKRCTAQFSQDNSL